MNSVLVPFELSSLLNLPIIKHFLMNLCSSQGISWLTQNMLALHSTQDISVSTFCEASSQGATCGGKPLDHLIPKATNQTPDWQMQWNHENIPCQPHSSWEGWGWEETRQVLFKNHCLKCLTLRAGDYYDLLIVQDNRKLKSLWENASYLPNGSVNCERLLETALSLGNAVEDT